MPLEGALHSCSPLATSFREMCDVFVLQKQVGHTLKQKTVRVCATFLLMKVSPLLVLYFPDPLSERYEKRF